MFLSAAYFMILYCLYKSSSIAVGPWIDVLKLSVKLISNHNLLAASKAPSFIKGSLKISKVEGMGCLFS